MEQELGRVVSVKLLLEVDQTACWGTSCGVQVGMASPPLQLLQVKHTEAWFVEQGSGQFTGAFLLILAHQYPSCETVVGWAH